MMSNSIQNRNFPVFFISKYVLILSIILLAVSCKSKTDWRDNYKKNKVEKNTTTSKKKVVNSPANLTEISKLLNVNENQLKNKSLYHFIVDWYGTPYKFGGTSNKGVDCSGFTNILFNDIYNIQLPRISRDIAEKVKRKYTKDLKEGDLVFFSFGNSGVVNHVGVYLHNNHFVHASTSRGVIISNLSEPYYGDYLVKCGSYE